MLLVKTNVHKLALRGKELASMEKVMTPQEKASLTEPSRNGQPKKMAIFLKSAKLAERRGKKMVQRTLENIGVF